VKTRFQSLPFKCNLQRYSTGDAKGVMLTHGNLDHQIRAGCVDMAVTAESTFVHWLPQVRGCTSRIQLIHHSLKAPGFNPIK
jgi:hypothetical protein